MASSLLVREDFLEWVGFEQNLEMGRQRIGKAHWLDGPREAIPSAAVSFLICKMGKGWTK